MLRRCRSLYVRTQRCVKPKRDDGPLCKTPGVGRYCLTPAHHASLSDAGGTPGAAAREGKRIIKIHVRRHKTCKPIRT